MNKINFPPPPHNLLNAFEGPVCSVCQLYHDREAWGSKGYLMHWIFHGRSLGKTPQSSGLELVKHVNMDIFSCD